MKRAIKISIALLMVLKSLFLSAQTSHKDSINTIVQLLEKEDRISINKYLKFTSKNASQLFSKATKEDLINLTQYVSPKVRAYSIYYLTQKYSELHFVNLIKEHLNDTETVQLMHWADPDDGCIPPYYAADGVGELFVAFIGSSDIGELPIKETVEFKPYLKDTINLQVIDSILICVPNKLKQTVNLFCNAPAKKNYYESVKDAVIYLSKYKKNNDLDLILNNLPDNNSQEEAQKFFSIFQNFHHPKLFKYLSDNMAKYYQDPFFLNAISGYKNKEALLLLQRAWLQTDADGLDKQKNNFVKQEIITSIKNNFTKIYAPFLFVKFEADPDGYSRMPSDLWKVDADRTYRYLLKCIYAQNENSYLRAYTFGQVLQILQQDAPAYIDDLLTNHLQPGADRHCFVNSMKYIYASKDKKYVIPLMDLLKKEKNKINSHVMIKILTSYNNLTVNQQLEKLFTECPALKSSLASDVEANKIYRGIEYEASKIKGQ